MYYIRVSCSINIAFNFSICFHMKLISQKIDLLLFNKRWFLLEFQVVACIKHVKKFKSLSFNGSPAFRNYLLTKKLWKLKFGYDFGMVLLKVKREKFFHEISAIIQKKIHTSHKIFNNSRSAKIDQSVV